MPKSILYSKFSKHAKHTSNYVEYLAKQNPLFSPGNEISVVQAQEQIWKDEMSIKWHQIYSLTHDDVNRLSIDRDYFKNLINIKKDDIAKAYNINPHNLQLVASYHEKDYHPHLHFIFWSSDKREGFVKTTSENRKSVLAKKSREIKGIFTNEIFREDLEEIKVRKNELRQEINAELEKALQELSNGNPAPKKEWAEELKNLGKEIQALPGKKVYGFLPGETKHKVDNLLYEMVTQNSVLDNLYNENRDYHRLLIDTYVDSEITMKQKMDKWHQSFFSPGKKDDTKRHNLIIKKAVEMASNKEKNRGRSGSSEPGSQKKYTYKEKSSTAYVSSLLYHLGKTLQDDNNRAYNQEQSLAHTKRKKRKKQQEKQLDIE